MNSKSLDFTLDKYRELCDAIQDNYTICTVHQYLTDKPEKNTAVLRHDVDYHHFVKKSLDMAKLESHSGIQSTYYFRYPATFSPDIIRNIRNFGHEIGYHYEVLSKTKGDYERAIQLFQSELDLFRSICPISTISMHGSPFSRYDNRDLWNTYAFEKYGLIGEAYLSFERSKKDAIYYLSDTGRNWSGKHSLKDTMRTETGKKDLVNLETTDDLILWLKKRPGKNLYLTVHPERWSSTIREWISWAFLDFSMNLGKSVISMERHLFSPKD